jgi:hypothetical protein
VKLSPGKRTILQLWSTDGSHSDLGELRRRDVARICPNDVAYDDANDALRTSSKW